MRSFFETAVLMAFGIAGLAFVGVFTDLWPHVVGLILFLLGFAVLLVGCWVRPQ